MDMTFDLSIATLHISSKEAIHVTLINLVVSSIPDLQMTIILFIAIISETIYRPIKVVIVTDLGMQWEQVEQN